MVLGGPFAVDWDGLVLTRATVPGAFIRANWLTTLEGTPTEPMQTWIRFRNAGGDLLATYPSPDTFPDGWQEGVVGETVGPAPLETATVEVEFILAATFDAGQTRQLALHRLELTEILPQAPTGQDHVMAFDLPSAG